MGLPPKKKPQRGFPRSGQQAQDGNRKQQLGNETKNCWSASGTVVEHRVTHNLNCQQVYTSVTASISVTKTSEF